MKDFSINCTMPQSPVIPANHPVSATSSKPPAPEPTFAPPPETPTQYAGNGIRFDFNSGLRIVFPDTGEYRLVFRNLDTDCLLYSMDVAPGCAVESVKKYFVRFGVDVYLRDSLDKPIFHHEFDLAGKDVLIQLPVGALGDTIAWFSFVERFQQKHGCRLYCSMAPYMSELFREQYPKITFFDKKAAATLKPYATYNLGLFFGDDVNHQPFDFRQIGLHQTAARILGLDDLTDLPPRLNLSEPRKIAEPYVCIAAQASSQCKYWNHPSGWREVVAELKRRGYRVLCIDKATEYGTDYTWNHIPYGCEDFTGDRPLQERINLIKDADMFIGLSSGLSWLAWCCRVPVILISGFTDPVSEFYTPYRVQNYSVCHGCWNDTRCEFDHFDFLWCPRKKEARDKFECTKSITPKMVIDKIAIIKQTKDKGDLA